MLTVYKDPFDNLLDSFFKTNFDSSAFKNIKVKTGEKEYKLYMSIPGLTKDDVKIKIKDGVLYIEYDGLKDGNDLVFTKKFKRSCSLPDDFDEKNISGSVENGVLELILPKQKEKIKERFISLN